MYQVPLKLFGSRSNTQKKQQWNTGRTLVTEDMPHPALAGDLNFHDTTEDALYSGTVLNGVGRVA